MNHKRKRRWQRIGISKSAIVKWKIDGNYRPRQTIENIGDNKNNINTIIKLFLWKTSLEILLDKAGLGGYFKEVWSSADFGEVKPSANLFEMAVSSVLKDNPDCSRSDILFTGDTYATDVAGAHRVGLKVAWINRRGEGDAEGYASYQIKEVTELRSICITERKEK